jgi:ribonuclease/clavin/mitogillin
VSVVPGAPGVEVVAVRTPTLAPATHTNTYVVGEGRLTVFDPASPYEDEQARLAQALAERISRGEVLDRIVLTHHHRDHVSGAEALRARFSTPERPIPIAAHPETRRLVADRIVVDELWTGGETLDLGGRTFQTAFTPGHAPGHLVFQDRDSGAVIAGDMVAGIGTILIDPEDGDLGQYLASLDAMAALSPEVLLPSHGPALPHATQVLAFYVAHRHQRTEQIRAALDRAGAAEPGDLVPLVYPELPPDAAPVAAMQILSHLRWMRRHGLASSSRGRWEIPR